MSVLAQSLAAIAFVFSLEAPSPPEIGRVDAMAHCVTAARTALVLLPLLGQDDIAMMAGMDLISKVDTRTEGAAQMSTGQAASLADSIFKQRSEIETQLAILRTEASATRDVAFQTQIREAITDLESVASLQRDAANQLDTYASGASDAFPERPTSVAHSSFMNLYALRKSILTSERAGSAKLMAAFQPCIPAKK
ncbi:MAG: hypothetical protein M3N19_09530 [Candidatus Eremiobacteraeota bacterium]|nr:hypothetical protein [Candidatus Eremiobacteraeota bacterium]